MSNTRYFRVGGAILCVGYDMLTEAEAGRAKQTYNGHDFEEVGWPRQFLTSLALEGQAISAAACAAAVLEVVEEWLNKHLGDDVRAVREAANGLFLGISNIAGEMTERDWMEKANEVLGEYDISMTMGMSGRVDYWARRPDIYAFGQNFPGGYRHILHVSMEGKMNAGMKAHGGVPCYETMLVLAWIAGRTERPERLRVTPVRPNHS